MLLGPGYGAILSSNSTVGRTKETQRDVFEGTATAILFNTSAPHAVPAYINMRLGVLAAFVTALEAFGEPEAMDARQKRPKSFEYFES